MYGMVCSKYSWWITSLYYEKSTDNYKNLCHFWDISRKMLVLMVCSKNTQMSVSGNGCDAVSSRPLTKTWALLLVTYYQAEAIHYTLKKQACFTLKKQACWIDYFELLLNTYFFCKDNLLETNHLIFGSFAR